MLVRSRNASLAILVRQKFLSSRVGESPAQPANLACAMKAKSSPPKDEQTPRALASLQRLEINKWVANYQGGKHQGQVKRHLQSKPDEYQTFA